MTPEPFEVFVAGRPAPQGSKTVYNGRAIESSKHLRPWRATVHEGARRAYQGDTMTDPLSLSLTFWLQRPKHHPKTRRTVPAVLPDGDKLARAVQDSLKTAGVVKDDALIVDLHVYKRYVHPEPLRRSMEPDTPGVTISLHSVKDAW